MDLSIMVDLTIGVSVLSHQDIVDTYHSGFNRESYIIVLGEGLVVSDIGGLCLICPILLPKFI